MPDLPAQTDLCRFFYIFIIYAYIFFRILHDTMKSARKEKYHYDQNRQS